MPYSNLSAELTDAVIVQIKTKIAEIEALLPFLISLSPAERKKLPKISSASAFFVSDALTAASSDPSFLPPYVSLAELEKDLALFEQFEKISLPLGQLSDAVADTKTAAGSEAFVAALSFYNSVKRAAKDGALGAEVIADRLHKRFEQAEGEAPVAKP